MGTLISNIKLLFLLVAWLTVLLPKLAVAVPEKPSSVQDLRYGVALYHYFQRDYYDSLSELLVAEQRGGVQGHGDTADIMKGGLSLSMGMEKHAAEIFKQILNESHPLDVRNAAWFYLAKLRYRQGNWEGAAESLSKIAGSLNTTLQQEKRALQTNLAIREHQLSEAELDLQTQEKMTPWLPYVYYNLGAAHAREGNHSSAVFYFDSLAAQPLQTEEHLNLRDKALTAAGYSWMQQGNYSEAIARFTKVRLNSVLINQALLGYGWAAVETEDFALALSPWQNLAMRSPVNPSVQEAMLAIPFAYEKLGANGQALEAFKRAEEKYGEQLSAISEVSSQLQAGDLLASLQASTSENPYLIRLSELLAQQVFQNRVRGLRDLLDIRQRLQDWQDKLEIYSHLLDQREIVRAQRLAVIEEKQFAQHLKELEKHYQLMANRLTEIEQQKDVIALASEATLSLWKRVVSSEQAMQVLGENGEDITEYSESLRRYKGLLLWQAMEAFPENRWAVEKELKQLESEVLAARQHHQELQQIISLAPDIIPHRARLTALQERLISQQLALTSVLNQSEEALLALVSEELDQQVQKLRYYQGHARLSVARLYDMARDALLDKHNEQQELLPEAEQ